MATPKRRVPKRRAKTGQQPVSLTIQREERVFEMSALGYTQMQIAQELRISQATVSRSLARAEARHMADLSEKIDAHKTRQLASLRSVYQEAMAAWRRSQGTTTKTTHRIERDAVAPLADLPEGQPVELGTAKSVKQVTEEVLLGDPRYLGEALSALQAQRKLLGLDAPVKFKGTVASERPHEDMTLEELEREVGALLATHAVRQAQG